MSPDTAGPMSQTPTPEWRLLRADRLLDGLGGPPLERATLVLRRGRIHSVHSGEAPRGEWPPDAPVLDLHGQTLLPGLIDVHVHLTIPGDGTPFEEAVREPEGTQTALAIYNAGTALRAGITTLRDCGSMHETSLHLRRARQLGYARLPRLHVCGCPITTTGGHCRYFGGETDGPEGMRQMVRRLVRAGVDFIKIMASGGGTVGTLAFLPSYTVEELRAAVDEAHRQNRRAGIHCTCAQASRNAVAAGTDHIEHASFLTGPDGGQRFEPDVADLVAGTAPVTGTLSVSYFVEDALSRRAGTAASLPEDQVLLDRYRRTKDSRMDIIRRMRAAGVRYVAGTDAGWRFTPFDGLAREMQLLADTGATRAEAIVAATSAAAAVLGLEGETGALRPGLAGDVIAVPGDPLADLAVLERPSLVMLEGDVVASAAAPPAGAAAPPAAV